jgi:hypothetical protein
MANTTFSGPVISNNGFIYRNSFFPHLLNYCYNVDLSLRYDICHYWRYTFVLQRLAFTSTGSGETYRALTQVTGAGAATGGTVNGAHISLSINGSGTISGAGNALRATWAVHVYKPRRYDCCYSADSNFASGGTWTNASFIRF